MEWLTSLINALGAVMIGFGVFKVFSGANTLMQNRQHGQQMNDDSEWWKILQGGLWVAFGASSIVLNVVNSIKL